MPRYAVHSSAVATPLLKIRPASASIALDRTSVVVMVITLSHRRRTRHGGVSSGLALSGPPADGFFWLVAAQPAGADRVAQVPGEGVVLRGDGADRGADAHRDRLAGALGRVSGEPGPCRRGRAHPRARRRAPTAQPAAGPRGRCRRWPPPRPA